MHKRTLLKGLVQIILFMLIIWILLAKSPDFSLLNFFAGTIIFALGVIANIYLESSRLKKQP